MFYSACARTVAATRRVQLTPRKSAYISRRLEICTVHENGADGHAAAPNSRMRATVAGRAKQPHAVLDRQRPDLVSSRVQCVRRQTAHAVRYDGAGTGSGRLEHAGVSD